MSQRRDSTQNRSHIESQTNPEAEQFNLRASEHNRVLSVYENGKAVKQTFLEPRGAMTTFGHHPIRVRRLKKNEETGVGRVKGREQR